jgi:hypothetical protein
MRLADIAIPSSAAARAAAEVVARYSAPALVNHCVRAYLFAAARAELDGLEIDRELLYVSAMLHDLGLEPAFDSHTVPFEQAGGHVAWVFAAGAGWPDARRDRAAEVIVAHMVGTDVAVDPEGHLLDLSTGLDISGRGVDGWPADLVSEIVAAHPRLDLADRFIACFRDQAERKPGSSAAAAIHSGLADRLAANPLDRL